MKRRARTAFIGACALLLFNATSANAIVRGKPVAALAFYGEPKFSPGTKKNLDFVNPNAPKGGTLILSNRNDQPFDTFNPFTLKGTPAQHADLMFDALMTGPLTPAAAGDIDEPFTHYCVICETVEVAEDNGWVEFKLRPQAKFNDGTAITADDVAFSFTTLTEKGGPDYRLYWADVGTVQVRDPRTVRFLFKIKTNRELPLTLGELPVLSKAYWSKRDFTATSLDIPVGSGPYVVEAFESGRYVTYKRAPNYWANDLPLYRGFYNFDRVRIEYFHDQTVAFEAFKSGTFDIQREVTARQWMTNYDFPAAKDGRVIKLEVADATPMLAQAFFFNLRHPLFQDRRVRQALNYAFDFESLNRTIFYGKYTRLKSYWQRSDLEASGPPTSAELALLEPLKDEIPPEALTEAFAQPVTDGRGNVRANLLKARDLLAEAGWKLQNGQLMKDGKPFTFELLAAQSNVQAIASPWLQNLERLGIKATIRVVDPSQHLNRVANFDFDVVGESVSNSLSPGNEQREAWGSMAADRTGSRNLSGVKNPAIDALIDKVVAAPDRESLETATRALDRVLTWNFYGVLHYGAEKNWYAYWSKLKHPDRLPLTGLAEGHGIIATWWMDPAAAKTQPAK